MARPFPVPLLLTVAVNFASQALTTTAQRCDLTFYLTGTPQHQQRVVFTGLTAEERASSGNTTTGLRLTCACANITGLTPLQWMDVNGTVLPKNRRQQLVDFKVANSQPGSAVHLRINEAGFSCAEAGNYTCVAGNNTRTVLVAPVGEECGPTNAVITTSPNEASSYPVLFNVPETITIAPSIAIDVFSTPEDMMTTTVVPSVEPSGIPADTAPDVAFSTPTIISRLDAVSSSLLNTPVAISPTPRVGSFFISTTASSTPVVLDSVPRATDILVANFSASFVIPSTQDVFPSISSTPVAIPVTPSSTPVAVSTTPVVTPSSTTAPSSAPLSPSSTPRPPVDLQPPTDVSVSPPHVSDDAVQITLMWSKSELDSGPTCYRVQYSWESRWDPNQFVKRQSEPKTMSVNVAATSYKLQDAEGFAKYCFEVSALYEGREASPAADEKCIDTPEIKPSPPLNLREVFSSVTTSSVRLQWDAPDPPNGNIMHFKVYYSGGAPRQYLVSDWHRQGYVVLDRLDPNTEYHITVTAVTATAESNRSNGLRVVTRHASDVETPSDSGELIGTVVTAAVLLVFTNAVSVVTTFLCTRRCYRQKSSNARPPSPEEKGPYYEAVELDSVQMQSSPAYASVDEAKHD